MANLAPRRHSGDDFDHPMLAFYNSSPAETAAQQQKQQRKSKNTVSGATDSTSGDGGGVRRRSRTLSGGAIRLAGALVAGLDDEMVAESSVANTAGAKNDGWSIGTSQTPSLARRTRGPPPPISSAESIAASLRRVASGKTLTQALGGLGNLGIVGKFGGGGRANDIALHLENAREAAQAFRHQEALLEYRSAEPLQLALHGPDSIEVADTLHEMGLVLVQLGAEDPTQHYAAMSAFEGALTIRQSKLGAGHESCAETTTQITMLLDQIRKDTGQGDRKLIRGDSAGSHGALWGLSSLSMSSISEGDSISDSDDEEDDMGGANRYTVEEGHSLFEMGRYKEAEKVLASCLEQARQKKSSGVQKRSSMERTALTEMARVGQALGKYDQAKESASQALESARVKASEKEYKDPKANFELARCIATFAEVLRKNKELDFAEKLHREALGIRQDLLSNSGVAAGDEENDRYNLALAESHSHLGCVLYELGKYEKAYRRHRLALFIRVTCLDFVDVNVSESLLYAAQALAMLGPEQAGKAIPFALHSIEIRKLEFGMKHPAFAHSLSVLAMCYHAVGRSSDALPFWEQCLEICSAAFYPKHANLIPNHVGYGKALEAVGQRKAALKQFCKAEEIHLDNFVVEDAQLREIREKIEVLLQNTSPKQKKTPKKSSKSSQEEGDPLIVITDVGRDVDDELALCLLKPLTDLKLVKPIAVVTTLAPQGDRARLARGTLDSLGLHDVPVGVGSNGGVDEETTAGLECYAGTFRAPPSSVSMEAEVDNITDSGRAGIVMDGLALMVDQLRKAAPKSVRVLCLASLNDVARLIEEDEDLFADKVKEFVCMGGIELSANGTLERLEPDTAYNNNCCLDAARKVYSACERLSIPTVTLTRWAAYGCPFSNTLLDELRSTKHLLAANIRNTNLTSTNKLWRKVNLPPDDPQREKLPARCDRKWFCERFLGTNETKLDSSASIWHCKVNFFMYDPLALLCCVPALRSRHFFAHLFTVNGVDHCLIGKSESENPIVVRKALVHEIRSLLFGAFREALPLRAKVSRHESTARGPTPRAGQRMSGKFELSSAPSGRFDAKMVPSS